MFIRTKTFQNKDGSTREYLQIVASVREGGRVRQKVIGTLGRREELEDGAIDRLLERLAAFSRKLELIDAARDLRSDRSLLYGPVVVFRALWEKAGLDAILRERWAGTEAQTDFVEAAACMTIKRLLDPESKRRTYRWSRTVYAPPWWRLELHHFYRALDFLTEHKEAIEERLFLKTCNLFSLDLTLVFFDGTSTYFEGEGPEGLARRGHSRDKRRDRPQLYIGLLMSRDGIPIAHEVLPGNTHDTVAAVRILEACQKRFRIRHVVFVGDKGVIGKKTRRALQKADYGYILATRLRNVAKIRDHVLTRGGRFRKVADNLYVKEVWHDGERFVVCFNPAEARREKESRRAILERLAHKLDKEGLRSLVGHREYRRYLKLSGTRAEIDPARVRQEARYDGKWVLEVASHLSTEDVAIGYKQLYQVEHAFRDLKSVLEMRPVRHWTESRVRGHVMVCFLALYLEMAFRRLLREQGVEASWRSVLDDLELVEATHLRIKEKDYLIRTELHGLAHAAFRAVGAAVPPRVQPLAPQDVPPPPPSLDRTEEPGEM